MTYGTPQDTNQHRYAAVVASTTQPYFTMYVTVDEMMVSNVSETEADNLMQSFIDLINASSMFDVSGGSKTWSLQAEITPTP